jgi:lysyl-tRNA synthetase class 2
LSQYESQFEENLYQLRRDKLTQIAAIVRATNPAITDDSEAKYPNTFAFTHTLPAILPLGKDAAGNDKTTEDLAAEHIEAAIAGRIMAIRVQGKAGFATLQQGGARLQIYVRKDDVGEDIFSLYKLLDLGDHIGVRGYLMRTRTGELTLHASPVVLPSDEALPGNETPAVRAAPAISFLAKAMLALPDKYHGLEDIELRYRRRYLDLFTDTGDFTEAKEPTTEPTPAPTPSSIPENSVILSEAHSAQPSVILSEAHSAQPSVILSEAHSAQPKDPDAANATSTVRPLSATQPAATQPAATQPTLTRLPAREVFVKRAAILRSIRNFFDTRGYLEVETPMLHTIAGGAAARPFNTHHNTLDIPLSLRIAPELHLKRLVVGGLDRVYEINRNFRNEGTSTQHNPEFTMLEFYQAYANYHDLMQLTQDLITTVAQEVNGTTLTNFNGTEIDLSKWTKLSMREAIRKWWPTNAFGIAPTNQQMGDAQTFIEFAATAKAHEEYQRETTSYAGNEYVQGVRSVLFRAMAYLPTGETLGKIIAELFEAVAEPHLIQPTIIYDFPLAVSPLSKVKPNEPDWVERFEFYIGGFEVGNAFSELNDPHDQRARFLAQLAERERGDDEAMSMDEDYVRALGYGLPPTAGEGIGIDRLTMILTGSRSIRDVILFPLMRPPKPATETTEPEHTHGESAE